MAEPLFPFELDGVVVVAEDCIELHGARWRPMRTAHSGQWTLRRNWLLSGAATEAPDDIEVWASDGGATMEPSSGPAWRNLPYVPTPAYLREQVIRRRAGLPMREREWVDVRPNAPDRRPGRRPDAAN
ncbi:MAG: hypothetical protein U0821_13115 [Chloroflexota bacterium]